VLKEMPLMSFAAVLLACLPALAQAEGPCPCGAFLYQPSFCLDHVLRGPAHPYLPQPGDIFLATDHWVWARLGHRLNAHSGAPHHSGIVFALPDGQPALLEGGPENTLHDRILDLIPTLTKYTQEDRVWIRQRCVPLTAEQSHLLTAFALTMADRRFGAVRMLLQGTPLRAKGLVRTPLLGKPRAECFDPDHPEPWLRHRYFCSELVVNALVAAGLQDYETSRPMSMYPRNLFFGDSKVPYLHHHLDMSEWLPPARFTPCPGHETPLTPHPWQDRDTCQ
jgi:hypothetical protein